MAIPKYDEMYRVFLECLADMQQHKSKELRDIIAARHLLYTHFLAIPHLPPMHISLPAYTSYCSSHFV